MTITFPDEAIEELRQIAEREFGKPFSHDEARVVASNLLELYEVLAEAAPKS